MAIAMTLIAQALFLYFPLLVFLHLTTKYLLHKIRNRPPTPLLALPILGHLLLLKEKPLYRNLAKLTSKNGPLLFLQLGSRKLLVVSTPSLTEECLTKNDVVFASRPQMLIGKHLGYNYKSIGVAPYGDHWRNLRKIVSLELLSAHRLQTLSFIRVEEVKKMVSRVFKLATDGTVVDMRKQLFELTLNIMMMMIAGKRYYGDHALEDEEARKFQVLHEETFRLTATPCTSDFLPWIRATKFEERLARLQRRRDEFLQGLIDEERKRSSSKVESEHGEKKKELTFLQALLSLQANQPECYTDETIKSLMIALLLAGTDTTINTMEWALSLLLNHTNILTKAQTEIDHNIGHDRLISEQDLPNLPYLRAIISETMRIYPPIPLLLPHESVGECSVGGYRVPQGTMLFINTWSIQRDPKVWDDPTGFKPERFMGNYGDGQERTFGFRLLPFGHGRRSCPGELLGLKVVGLALGSLIQCFDWKTTDGELVDMSEGTSITMPKAEPLKAFVRPRSCIDLISQFSG